MAHLDENELTALYERLQRNYLAATPGQRARIDVALVQVERLLARQRRRHFLQQLRTWVARATDLTALVAAAATGECAAVARVVDGDTLLLEDGRRVRYIGMDAPELFAGYRRLDAPQPYAEAAQAANDRLVAGHTVHLLADAEPLDRYGRLLRYVFCDGVFVNAQLILTGMATFYPVPPNEQFADLLARCEVYARQRRAGLWRNQQK